VMCIDVEGDESYALEVGVLETVDEVAADEAAATVKQARTDETSKDASFIVNLHGLPYNATLEDVADFLEGLLTKNLFLLCRE